MGSRLFALGTAVALLAVAGCSDHRSEAAGLPPVQIVQQPAASAGGACILWDYEFIEEKIGVRFSVAAADQVDITSTCVVQTEREEWPYLALSVVESTKADASTFAAENIPAKATKLKGLGKAGYRLVSKASGGHGPTVEIGWLSEAAQLQTLRYTFAKGAAGAEVTKMSTKLLALAKAMDTTNG
ncbi:hypothetical protein ACFQFC_30615 [Amorphoplanes digitatis]|uniref:DUF3558 domain-containing protein n=1 Tax=Actinoplanes digitatis TaxID=1868 RepID=A0A7W7MN03_9ACTN|nr:hypothetical protein [Actinoplanes digitatis]MBB4760508.1 hypothetical protein [Actinoplanes digitatis]GID98178.1 hypothetical protein Adi01nite_75900 [Actinoplanes digitatis]